MWAAPGWEEQKGKPSTRRDQSAHARRISLDDNKWKGELFVTAAVQIVGESEAPGKTLFPALQLFGVSWPPPFCTV